MSHFSVLVVTDEEPTEDVLGKVMQPWHEFECTGIEDEYVQDMDITSEVKEEYESHKDDYPTLAQFAEAWYGKTVRRSKSSASDEFKFGWTEVGIGGEVVKIVDRTNPNKKWDYWRVGGRYLARLQQKDGCASGVVTEPSWEYTSSFLADRPPIPKGIDQCRVEDLDTQKMREVEQRHRRTLIDECIEKSSLENKTDQEFAKAVWQETKAHEAWRKLDEKPRGQDYYEWLDANGYRLARQIKEKNFYLPPLGALSVDAWLDATPSIMTFAIVMDGQWHERGTMGWWATVSDEVDDWDEQFLEMWDSLRPDQWVSVLDCHI